jgi:hypothetical protein
MIRALLAPFRRFLAGEKGTASLEFVISVPILMVIFCASFESGLLMMRSILLEQAVDRTMRELRLGHYPLPTSALLKEEICSRGVILQNCEDNITIELVRVSTSSWSVPTGNIQCVDRDEDIDPVLALQIGQQNDVMLVRICVIQDALFPNMAIGAQMPLDGRDGYALITTSAFVTEPT